MLQIWHISKVWCYNIVYLIFPWNYVKKENKQIQTIQENYTNQEELQELVLDKRQSN